MQIFQKEQINFYDFQPKMADFCSELLNGLSKKEKTVSSKFFYDEKGSQIFTKICKLDEYYPTRLVWREQLTGGTSDWSPEAASPRLTHAPRAASLSSASLSCIGSCLVSRSFPATVPWGSIISKASTTALRTYSIGVLP